LDEKALSAIQLCLSQEVLRDVIKVETDADLWLQLEGLYDKKPRKQAPSQGEVVNYMCGS